MNEMLFGSPTKNIYCICLENYQKQDKRLSRTARSSSHYADTMGKHKWQLLEQKYKQNRVRTRGQTNILHKVSTRISKERCLYHRKNDSRETPLWQSANKLSICQLPTCTREYKFIQKQINYICNNKRWGQMWIKEKPIWGRIITKVTVKIAETIQSFIPQTRQKLNKKCRIKPCSKW